MRMEGHVDGRRILTFTYAICGDEEPRLKKEESLKSLADVGYRQTGVAIWRRLCESNCYIFFSYKAFGNINNFAWFERRKCAPLCPPSTGAALLQICGEL